MTNLYQIATKYLLLEILKLYGTKNSTRGFICGCQENPLSVGSDDKRGSILVLINCFESKTDLMNISKRNFHIVLHHQKCKKSIGDGEQEFFRNGPFRGPIDEKQSSWGRRSLGIGPPIGPQVYQQNKQCERLR